MHQFLTKKHMTHVPKYDILLQIIQVFEPTLNSIKTERGRKPESNTRRQQRIRQGKRKCKQANENKKET
jgi:hypothetical protein